MRNEDISLAFALFLIATPHAWDLLVIMIGTMNGEKLVGVKISHEETADWVEWQW